MQDARNCLFYKGLGVCMRILFLEKISKKDKRNAISIDQGMWGKLVVDEFGLIWYDRINN